MNTFTGDLGFNKYKEITKDDVYINYSYDNYNNKANLRSNTDREINNAVYRIVEETLNFNSNLKINNQEGFLIIDSIYIDDNRSSPWNFRVTYTFKCPNEHSKYSDVIEEFVEKIETISTTEIEPTFVEINYIN